MFVPPPAVHMPAANFMPPPFCNPTTCSMQQEDLKTIISSVINEVHKLNINNNNINSNQGHFQNICTFKPNADVPIFDDKGDIHPVDFLNQIETMYKSQNVSVDQFLVDSITNLFFRGNAKIWMNAFLSTFTNFQDFKNQFLAQYWSQSQQLKIRLKLDSDIYPINGSATFTEYFNSYVVLAKHLEPAYPPPQLIQIIARHFPPSISCTLIGAVTFQDALQRLRQAEYYFSASTTDSFSHSTRPGKNYFYKQNNSRHGSQSQQMSGQNQTKNLSSMQTVDNVECEENSEN